MPKLTEPERGPGFRRMQERLGPDAMEALRQDTLRRQEAALAEAASGHPATVDRAHYVGYPAPRSSKRRR